VEVIIAVLARGELKKERRRSMWVHTIIRDTRNSGLFWNNLKMWVWILEERYQKVEYSLFKGKQRQKYIKICNTQRNFDIQRTVHRDMFL